MRRHCVSDGFRYRTTPLTALVIALLIHRRRVCMDVIFIRSTKIAEATEYITTAEPEVEPVPKIIEQAAGCFVMGAHMGTPVHLHTFLEVPVEFVEVEVTGLLLER